MFQITYEGQLVCKDLDNETAVLLVIELNAEAIANKCEPLYLMEPQPTGEQS